MLRYVRYDLLQQDITEFCCGRVTFPNVKIEVPDLRLLVDQSFILNNIKKYRRGPECEPLPVRAVCGKCDGYGFYDWVVRIRSEEGVDEDDLYGVGKEPVVVRNETPITTLFIDTQSNTRRIYIHYISQCLAEAPMSYRCEQCGGTGMTHFISNQMTKFTREGFLDFCHKKPEITIKRKPTFKERILNYLKPLYKIGGSNDRTFQNRNNRQEIR